LLAAFAATQSAELVVSYQLAPDGASVPLGRVHVWLVRSLPLTMVTVMTVVLVLEFAVRYTFASLEVTPPDVTETAPQVTRLRIGSDAVTQVAAMIVTKTRVAM